MKLICWWLGTDSLTLWFNPPTSNKLWHIKLFFYRIKWKILHKLFDQHWIDNERLRKNLIKFGIDSRKIQVVNDDVKYPVKIEKKAHKGFNILYYIPGKPANLGGIKFLNWLYGFDIYEKLTRYFAGNSNINFIVVTGKMDMNDIYPIIDLYIRPTRHDGNGRMLEECKINDIPYLHSENGNPEVNQFIETIINHYERDSRFH